VKEQTKKNIKTAAALTGLALGATYLVMRHIAKKQYPKSVYADKLNIVSKEFQVKDTLILTFDQLVKTVFNKLTVN
jgi:hypothetical protein